ncbi:MAG TPA: RNA pseudouridine synthase [Syntrophales bacterium]|nr:RNA pseudouridine synthase [Syntrophales bacterium]
MKTISTPEPGTESEILFEDQGILAVSKTAGDLVIPGRGSSGESLVDRLSRERKEKLFIVHRLDREASGVVLFARDRESHRYLSGLFAGRRVRKTYWAVVQGEMAGDGVITSPIHAFGSGRMGVDGRGKPSETRYRVRKGFPGAAWVEAEPLTGRRHQIRVHLYSLGHPLLGETRYGTAFPVGGVSRLMLHALKLVFPWNGKEAFEIFCPPGRDFMTVLENLGALSPSDF